MPMPTRRRYVCARPADGLLLAGDTAQTIAKGVAFRFEALKDLFYLWMLRGGPGGQGPPAPLFGPGRPVAPLPLGVKVPEVGACAS